MRRHLTGAASSAVIIAALGYGGAAAAQEPAAKAGEVEEVVVTGLRSVTGALPEIKRGNLAIVDSQTAEQIDRRPDASLSDVLDRVVGVSMVPGFNTSDSRTVTLRGFDSRYNSMSIDGNPIWNSSRNNRGTQADVFPASVVNQTNVFKTVTPDQDANSIGGAVELRTLRAFDGGTQTYGKLRASVGGYDQSGYAYDDADPTYRADGVVKFTFGPEKNFGAVLGFEAQQSDFYDEYNLVTGVAQVGGVDIPAGNLFPSVYERQVQRQAFYGKLETRVPDQYYAFLSASYFRHDEHDDYYRGGVFLDAARVRNPVEKGGEFVNATAETFAAAYDIERQTTLIAGGLDYRTSPRGQLRLRASYTLYDHDETNITGERFQYNGLSGTYSISDSYPTATLNPNAGVGDPANWVHRTGRDSVIQTIPHKDNVYSFRADYGFNSFEAARGLGAAAGVNFRRLDRDFNQTSLNYRLPAGRVLRLSEVISPQSTPLSGVGAVIIDADRYFDLLKATITPTTDLAAGNDYNLVEDVYAGHLELTYATDRFRALAGLRVEATEYTNRTSDTQPNGSFAPVARKFDYTRVLPNVQASYDLRPDLRVRGAYTQTIGRPDFADFAMGQRRSLDINGNPVIQGSNPYLDPRESKNFDLSLEYYFPGGYASLGLFHKDLDNETFSQRRETRDAGGVVILTEIQPLNTGSAKLKGLEANLVVDRFSQLPRPFDGFGFSANYTYLDGEWNVVFTDGSRRTVDGLRNQPRWLANLNLTYDIGRLNLTAAWRLRGRTFTGNFGTTAAGDRYIDSYDRLDLQAAYNLPNGLQVFGEVRNLNEAYFVEQTGLDGDFLFAASNPGRSFNIGVKAKF